MNLSQSLSRILAQARLTIYDWSLSIHTPKYLWKKSKKQILCLQPHHQQCFLFFSLQVQQNSPTSPRINKLTKWALSLLLHKLVNLRAISQFQSQSAIFILNILISHWIGELTDAKISGFNILVERQRKLFKGGRLVFYEFCVDFAKCMTLVCTKKKVFETVVIHCLAWLYCCCTSVTSAFFIGSMVVNSTDI